MRSPRVIAIIQGRMSSSRLRGKILAEIAGQPMLQRVFIRTSRAASVTETIFATTIDSSDDPVVDYCNFSGIPLTRGSQFDVLDRYYQAAQGARADVVVRATADCPVIDPMLIDDAVKTLLENEYDFVANRLPPPFHRTYPIGLDVEVCTFKVIEKAWKESTEAFHREHVMPYLYEGVELSAVSPQKGVTSRQLSEGISPRGFRIALLNHTTDFGNYRWTVDTPADLAFMRQIYNRFGGRDDFSWKEVLDLVHDEPTLMEINAGVQHKTLKDVDDRAIK
jgi:spore coat polysaccharide biosynthesis protein SpsF